MKVAPEFPINEYKVVIELYMSRDESRQTSGWMIDELEGVPNVELKGVPKEDEVEGLPIDELKRVPVYKLGSFATKGCPDALAILNPDKIVERSKKKREF